MKTNCVEENQRTLLSLPQLVLDKIYGYLGSMEQISLRRVCQGSKDWGETYFNLTSNQHYLEAWRNKKVSIYEDNGRDTPTIRDFLDANLGNLTNFHIKNQSRSIYSEPLFSEFVNIYGQQIESLIIDNFFDCDSQPEQDFFDSLTNLKSLEIGCHIINHSSKTPPPRFLETLTEFKSDEFKIDRNSKIDPKDHWAFNLTLFCPNLEGINCPTFSYPRVSKRLAFISNLITSLRKQLVQESVITLKWVDLKNLNYVDDTDADLVLELVDLCASNDIKLLNVDMRFPINVRDECIVSVQNICWNFENFVNKTLPNLEGIRLDDLSTGWGVPEMGFRFRKTWPKLKTLSLCFKESVFGFADSSSLATATQLIMNTEPRSGVETLEIKFEKVEDHYTGQRMSVTFPSIIKASSITRNFANLTSLSIIGWNLDDASFAHLWKGLPKLEVLKIEDCSSASDAAFIGENQRDKAFLQLKRLKKLSLCLDNMYMVSDRFLKEVLRHMPIKECVIQTAPDYIPTVTLDGFSSLLEGAFSKSIERFILDVPALAMANIKAYRKLQNAFRSTR